MSETTPPKEVQPTEAGFSTNMYLTHPIMGRIQFTFRGALSADWGLVLEDVDRFAHYMREKGWKFDGEVPAAPAPVTTIQVKDENGIPVVDGDLQPVTAPLPEGVHLFTVAGLVHDMNKDETKDILKVFTMEAPYNKGYGVSCFHPPAELKDFKNWPRTTKENKNRFAAPATCLHVLIRDPKGDSKYPDVIEFRP